MRASKLPASTPDCEIVTTRTFNAPRQLVYKAWTDPAHLKIWWGPNGFTNTFNTFDLRVGGKWSFVMHGPEKGNYVNEVTFLLVDPPRHLLWERQTQPFFQVEVILEEVTNNETKVIFKQIFRTPEECAKLRKYVPEKNEENMDRLEEELKKMQVAR
jgi:uncharacterized protein YndB with AHSA1/START domain